MSKKILITGGAGFIAHHVVDLILKKTDWEIVTLDRLDFSGNLNRLQEVVRSYDKINQKRVKVVFHDLKAEINPEVKALIGKVDYIAHLAAGSHVDRSIKYPLEFVKDNVLGTANMLEFARSIDSLQKFIYFSTDEVFGPALNGKQFKENERYNSTNPYSASKAGGEELVVAYENTYGLPGIITHTMNVFGERQSVEKYIPMVIKKVRDGELVTVHSDSSKKIAGSRHYIHAGDVADALFFLINYDTFSLPADESGIKCQKFNIVGRDEIDNLSLAQFIAKVQKKSLKYEMVDFHSSRPGHDLRYALDGTKMKDMGWEPKSAYERLEETIHWTLKNDRWLI
ncbi:MAG: NAD-dependent epimerase [Candidatus Pelagibacter sp. TMED273]|nr:MAG: NAD-dependent epimerase [Candidatus Pelagibacter sp. TMED273]|tara:strand:- start:14916 stop:15938 length:1023 start_codon:yes stop_codon:yes gene_type:complete